MKRVLQLSVFLVAFLIFTGNAWAQCAGGETQLTVTVKTDQYPDETTWKLVNYATGAVLASGGPYSTANSTFTSNVCVSNTATVQFEIYDAYGDGICCAYGNGFYNVTSGTTTLINGGTFGDVEVKLFAVNPQTKDLLVKKIDMQNYVLAGSKQIPGTLYNVGTTAVSSFDLNYRVNGGTVQTQTGIVVTIAPGGEYNFTHSLPWLLDFGTHNIEVWASNLDGGADLNTENDMAAKTVYAAFELGDRQVLIEHFTQASCPPCATQNPIMQAVLNQQVNVGKYAHISYHTSWPGFDPMYNQNPADPDARVAYYGISGVPGVIMEGVQKGQPGMVTTAAINQWKNIPATSKILLEESFTSANTVSITVTVTSLVNMAPGNYKLHLVLIENMVTYPTAPGTNGEKDFPNVLRKMLPSASGTTMPALNAGETFSITQTYTIPTYINAAQLRTVAFIQENTSKVILQTFKPDGATGTNSYAESGVVGLLSSNITPSCGTSNNGAITLSLASGADALVYFQWTDGSTNATASNLAPGIYAASVYSVATNELLKTYVFEVGSVPAFNLTLNSVSSAGSANNGIASASASNGQPPYAYVWSSGQTGATATGLAPGTYTVSVTDATGCTQVGTVTVGDSVGIEDAQSVKVNCYPNPASGTATIVVANATTNATVRIVDIAGRSVLQQPITPGANSVLINTAQLSNGSYYCQVIDKGAVIGVQKLVVMH